MISSKTMADVKTRSRVGAAVAEAISGLIEHRERGNTSYVNLPLIYPDGSFVTVRVDQAPGFVDQAPSSFRVSDSGFAFRELECVGAERSFSKAAAKAAEFDSLSVSRHTIFADVPEDELSRALCDVALASWRVVDRVYQRLEKGEEDEIAAQLLERLVRVFGEKRLEEKHKIVGASTTEWPVSAIVDINGRRAVFQAVGTAPVSVYRTTSVFTDLAHLPEPPTCVAVVQDKEALGASFNILTQVGQVIEVNQPDDVYLRAAA